MGLEQIIAQITVAALGLLQQLHDINQRKANGQTFTETDLANERAKTQQLLAQGDAMRSTPRGTGTGNTGG